MKAQLSFFNLSLKKVLDTVPDSFHRAKIKILLSISVFTIVKLFIVIPFAVAGAQNMQLVRAVVIILIFTGLIKLLLYKPNSITLISHIMLLCGLAVVWSNILIYVHQLNIITMQIVLLTTLVSYYLIGGYKAGIYTILAIFPVAYCMLTRNTPLAHFDIATQELPSPGIEIIILLNFITFVITHYLYYRSYRENIKEKEILNEQLQINIKEVKALADSRSVFLSTVSHELRTPLNGVIGMTNLLKDSAIEEQRDYLNVLEFSATNLLTLINDILDYNKSELDRIELETVPVNLPVLLRKICAGLEVKAHEKNLAWKLELDEGLKNCTIITDPTRLTQIIYNLAGNAIKFTHRGGVKVSAKVLTRTQDKVFINFSVNDTGIGIPPDRHEAIFELFTQAATDTTRKYGGTGLGLAIVRRLLKLFGSTVSIESYLGKGSMFTFNIEFLLHHKKTVSGPASSFASLKGLKLLIADDNQVNTMLLQKLLKKWDVEPVVVTNGKDAVEQITNDNFDLVLMDVHMPIMDGFAATKAVRQLADPLKAQVPIIAVTGSVSQDAQAAVLAAGMQDLLPKPYQPEQLYQKIQHVHKPVH